MSKPLNSKYPSKSGSQAIRESFKREVIKRLDKYSIRLDADRKDQHLLINPEVICDLISFADVTSDDIILEIGSGPGTITEQLAKRAKLVLAVEFDKRFRPLLQELRNANPNIEVVIGDFLHEELPPFNKIVANPPFHILDPMIQRFTREKFESASLVIGERYYYKTIAQPGSEEFTKMSLFTQASFIVGHFRRLEKEDFFPVSRKRAVIMKLISTREDRSIMKQLSVAFSKKAGTRVNVLVDDIFYRFGPKVSKSDLKYRSGKLTPSSLQIPEHLLRKRLQELSNREISMLVKKLMSINRKVD